MEAFGEIDPSLKTLAAHLRKKVPPFMETKSPLREEEAVKKAGMGGDTEIALVPFSVLKIFDAVRGEPQVNPKTGLPMYGFMDRMRGKYTVPERRMESPLRQPDEDDDEGNILANVLGVVAPIIGTAMGGPAGGALGSSITQAITSAETGQIRPARSKAREASEEPFERMSAPDQKKKENASEGSDDSWGAWGKAALPPALTLAGVLASMHGKRKEKAEEERRYQRDKAEEARRLKAAGYHSQLRTHFAPDDPSYRDVSLPKAVEYKTGGSVQGKPIQGPGNGQSDSINVDSTREGEWIWDASTVADLGDGSTDAGWKEIRHLENQIKRKPGFKEMHEFKPGVSPQKVKTALSNGEFRTPTKIVTALGDGDNTKGAAILRRMTQNIRIYKNSNGTQLPPPIKDPDRFLHQAVHQEMKHG